MQRLQWPNVGISARRVSSREQRPGRCIPHHRPQREPEIGVFGGLFGSIALALRRRVATPVFLASLTGHVMLLAADSFHRVFAAVLSPLAMLAFVVVVAASCCGPHGTPTATTVRVPDNPDAWLMTAARNSLKNAARHQGVVDASAADLALLHDEFAAPADGLPDDRLKLLFVCEHPAIDAEVRAPLMLQTVLGLDAARIGAAFWWRRPRWDSGSCVRRPRSGWRGCVWSCRRPRTCPSAWAMC